MKKDFAIDKHTNLVYYLTITVTRHQESMQEEFLKKIGGGYGIQSGAADLFAGSEFN